MTTITRRSMIIGVLMVIFMAGVSYAWADTSKTDDARYAPVIKGTYQYATNESLAGDVLLTDTYRYSDRWFAGSSYVLNRELAEVSATATLSTLSYYRDKKERDTAFNSQNVEVLLKGCGFKDVKGNKYYNREKDPDSVGCVIGHKTIKVNGRAYTLLAILPRSGGYKQEWVGNMTIGRDRIHAGFKAGRDEILRFTRNYIADNHIRGNLKIWIAGHSRGGAIANLLGGFFAEGGSGYFDGVTISPEDIYCYTFGSASTIRDKLKKAEALSVAGYRGNEDPRYRDDSAGEDFVYQGEDAQSIILPHQGIYRCIKTCRSENDIVSLVPPQKWGYDLYGVFFSSTDGSAQTKSRMKAELKKLQPDLYKQYVSDGDEADFRWKTIDFASLSLVDDKTCKEEISQSSFLRERVDAGLTNRASTTDKYVGEGYQDTMKGMAGVIGMGIVAFSEGLLQEQESVVKAAVFSYLAYAVERLGEERGLTEEQAIAVAVEELLTVVTGEQIDPNSYTVDDLVLTISKFIVDSADYYDVKAVKNTDIEILADNGQTNLDLPRKKGKVRNLKFSSKAAEAAFDVAASNVVALMPSTYRLIIEGYDNSKPVDSPENQKAARYFLFSILHMNAYGTTEKGEDPDPSKARDYRKSMYSLISLILSGNEYAPIVGAIGDDGSKPASELLNTLTKMMMVEKDASGKVIKQYDHVGDAADGALSEAIARGTQSILDADRYDKNSVYYRDVQAYGETLQNNVTLLRQLLMDMLFTENSAEGKNVPFDTGRCIRTACTFLAQPQKIALTHYTEMYVAWMRAQLPVETKGDSVAERNKQKDQAAITKAQNQKVLKLKLKAAKKHKVTVSWKKNNTVTGYQIWRAAKSNGKYTRIATINQAGKVRYTTGKLKKGKRYYFKIRAFTKVRLSTGKTRVCYGKWTKPCSIKVK